MLGSKKTVQSRVIPNNLLRGFCGFFPVFIYDNLNRCMEKGEYVDGIYPAPIQKNGGKEKSN